MHALLYYSIFEPQVRRMISICAFCALLLSEVNPKSSLCQHVERIQSSY